MIKPEKTPKIRKKTPKNPKNLPARFARRLEKGCLPAAKLGGVFFKKFFSRVFRLYPPLAMSDYIISCHFMSTVTCEMATCEMSTCEMEHRQFCLHEIMNKERFFHRGLNLVSELRKGMGSIQE